MKILIKTYNDKLPSYLTLNKLYDVKEIIDVNLLCVDDDNGDSMIIYTEDCVFLNGGCWEVVDCIEHKFINTINLCIICGKSKSKFIAEKVKAQQHELKKWKELR